MATPTNQPSVMPEVVGVAIDPTGPIGTALTNLTSVRDGLAGYLVSGVTAVERKRTAKVKHKAEGLIGTWFQLAIRKPGLAPRGMDPGALLKAWTLVEQLKVLVAPTNGIKRSVEDTVLVKLAELWTSAMLIYAAAQLVRDDGEVSALVAQTQSALSTGPRKQKAVKATVSEPIPSGKSLKKAAVAHAKADLANGGAPATPETVPPAAPSGTSPETAPVSAKSADVSTPKASS